MSRFSSWLESRFRRPRTGRRPYLPEIDGLRFLAIGMVVAYHFFGYGVSAGFWQDGDGVLRRVLHQGGWGVLVFFSLSGFVIALPFARHFLLGSTRPSLRHYYIRRFTRIEPPYLVAMLLMGLARWVLHPEARDHLFPSLLASLGYVHNIVFGQSSFIFAGAWTLEIELQFYLLAPLLMQVMRLPSLVRRSVLVAVFLFFLFNPLGIDLPFVTLHQYAHYFVGGVIIADLYASNTGAKILQHTAWAVVGVACLAGVLLFSPKSAIVGVKLQPLAVAALLLLVLRNGLMQRAFANRILSLIGGGCYSIYLMHYNAIAVAGFLVNRFSGASAALRGFFFVSLGILLILIISAAFYLFIERPFLAAASRKQPPARRR